jgi:hypothetical protein
LAHRLRRSKEALEIFFGSGSFLVASVCGSKETLWPLGSGQLERPTKLNFAGTFLDSIQDLGIIFSSLGQLVEFLFKFFWDKSRNHKFV